MVAQRHNRQARATVGMFRPISSCNIKALGPSRRGEQLISDDKASIQATKAVLRHSTAVNVPPTRSINERCALIAHKAGHVSRQRYIFNRRGTTTYACHLVQKARRGDAPLKPRTDDNGDMRLLGPLQLTKKRSNKGIPRHRARSPRTVFIPPGEVDWSKLVADPAWNASHPVLWPNRRVIEQLGGVVAQNGTRPRTYCSAEGGAELVDPSARVYRGRIRHPRLSMKGRRGFPYPQMCIVAEPSLLSAG
ncbi:hypothetical protein C8R46DRAFT_1120280 [Mycena filopes]|nr:hypothetical protein C8R46DRAFT_1120280 [Mycena filopes]